MYLYHYDRKTQIPYTNYMPKHKPLPVRVHFQNSSTKFKEIRAMENGEAMILTGDGLMVGKTVKNMYTSEYFCSKPLVLYHFKKFYFCLHIYVLI